uniref:Retrotransposon gag domain-containing protein n=1 Tax=Takifugu rubripes TaxID=31033 RepID=A0A3B5JZ66_TAKRU
FHDQLLNIHHALSRHGALLGQHKQLLQALVENRTHVAKAVADLMQQSCPILTSQRTSIRLFSNDFSKVFYLGGLLQGKELAWAEAVSSHNCLETMTYAELEGSLKAVFDHPDQPGDATTRLLSLHQGNRSVADFLEF